MPGASCLTPGGQDKIDVQFVTSQRTGGHHSQQQENRIVIRYFAYGLHLTGRTPRSLGAGLLSARPGVLRDHRMTAGHASVRRALGGQVHGVLYELSRADLEALEPAEPGTELADVLVECSRLDGGVEVLSAKTPMARADRADQLPPLPHQGGPGPQAPGAPEAHQHGLPAPRGEDGPPGPADPPEKPE